MDMAVCVTVPQTVPVEVGSMVETEVSMTVVNGVEVGVVVRVRYSTLPCWSKVELVTDVVEAVFEP